MITVIDGGAYLKKGNEAKRKQEKSGLNLKEPDIVKA